MIAALTPAPDRHPVVPYTCRVCDAPAVRYLEGKKRTFYCDGHGPSHVDAWPRLRYLARATAPAPAPTAA
ncbi:MAG: hypothetical protein JWL95_29, partial [Gemmatimonadetes bacterium]|nr:hypothetical protein [Gemmatimonadota bacterium]